MRSALSDSNWDPLTGVRLRSFSEAQGPATDPPTRRQQFSRASSDHNFCRDLEHYRVLLASKGAPPVADARAEEEALLRHSRRQYESLIRRRAELTFLRRSRQALSLAEKDQAEAILLASPGVVVAEWFNIQLTPRILQCLRPGDWLNDEVINVYMSLLNKRNDTLREAGHDVPKCFCWNTFFWTKLVGEDAQSYDYSQVKRWTRKRKIDVFALDVMLVPVNLRQVHWALGLVDFRAKRVSFLDSFAGTVAAMEFLQGIHRYLIDEHTDKKGVPLPDAEQWRLDNSPYVPIPQQTNGSDCGVFTCQFAECVTDGRMLDVNQAQISSRRIKMISQVFRGEIA